MIIGIANLIYCYLSRASIFASSYVILFRFSSKGDKSGKGPSGVSKVILKVNDCLFVSILIKHIIKFPFSEQVQYCLPVVTEIQLLQVVELCEGFGRDLLDVAVGEVEADQLRDHLEGVRLQLLQRVVIQPKLA